MKILALIIFLASTASFADDTKLELKSEGYYYPRKNHQVKIKFTKLNKELNKLGLDGLPETVVMTGENPEAYAKLLAKRVDAANEKLGREMHFNFYNQGSGETYLYEMTLCYRGDITGIPKLIEKLRGNFLHPEEGLLAIATGTKKTIIDKAFKSAAGLKERFGDEFELNRENIDKWLDYSSESDTALVMSDYGPQGDGTELEATEIPPCE